MRVIRKDLMDGSCNFCQRGELKREGARRRYPYTMVTEAVGSGIAVRFCDECLHRLRSLTNDRNSTPAMDEFEKAQGGKLEIGSRVSIAPDCEYWSDWRDEYIVIGISYDRSTDTYDITIADPPHLTDGGTDGWPLEDLRLILK